VKIETIINAIANGLLAAGVSAFMVMIYRSGGLVQKFPMAGSLLLRASLTITAAGALLNCLTLSTPADSEIMMNCGLAGIFVWAAWFHAKLIKYGPTHKYFHGNDESRSGQVAGAERSDL
jgi:hypothetical protein